MERFADVHFLVVERLGAGDLAGHANPLRKAIDGEYPIGLQEKSALDGELPDRPAAPDAMVSPGAMRQFSAAI